METEIQIELDALRRANSLLIIDGEFSLHSGLFVDLLCDLLIEVQRDSEDSCGSKANILKKLNCIQWDLSNIENLLDRLNWQHELWTSQRLEDSKWFRYAALDINHFHTEFRSIFDYLAQVIPLISAKPGCIKSTHSFETLFNWQKDSTKNQTRYC